MSAAEIIELLRMACHHGYPVRVYVKTESEPCAYDGWVRGSTTPSSVTISLGEQDYQFEWAEIAEATFFTPLCERLAGWWIMENL